MATLFELTGAWLEVYDMAGEVDDDVVLDTLESIEGEIEDKAVGYGKVIAQLNADADALAEEIKRLQARKKAAENHAARMKRRLQESMEAIGSKRIQTPLFTFRIQKNPPKVVIDHPENIPEKYLIAQEPKVDTKAIAADLKGGELYAWAHLVQEESLRIG